MSRSTSDPEVDAPVIPIERRAAPRYPILQRCSVHPARASALQAWKAIAYNISATGIGITLPMQLEVGTVLTIQAWNLPRAGALEARIVHAKPADNSWFTGCELLTPLSHSELQVWRGGPLEWLDDYHS